MKTAKEKPLFKKSMHNVKIMPQPREKSANNFNNEVCRLYLLYIESIAAALIPVKIQTKGSKFLP